MYSVYIYTHIYICIYIYIYIYLHKEVILNMHFQIRFDIFSLLIHYLHYYVSIHSATLYTNVIACVRLQLWET